MGHLIHRDYWQNNGCARTCICLHKAVYNDGRCIQIWNVSLEKFQSYDFDSLTLHSCKANLVHSLIFRAYNICSTYVSFHIELSRIKVFLWEIRSHRLLLIALLGLS